MCADRAPLPAVQRDAVLGNEHYRTVFYTNSTAGFQEAAMTISRETMGPAYADLAQPGVGWEQHLGGQLQYFAVESGRGILLLSPPDQPNPAAAERVPVAKGDKWFVQPGWWHDVRTNDELRLFTVYFPPHHAPGTVDLTRTDAERREQGEHDD